MDVAGAGAIGLLYAARLALAGERVTVWSRTDRQAELLNRRGIRLVQGDQSVAVPVRARAAEAASRIVANENETCDVLWLTVKQSQLTEPYMRLVERIATSETNILCLQNGIGHMERLRSRLPHLQFTAAVTTEGALREDEAEVRWTGQGELWIEGEAGGKSRSLKQKLLLERLDRAGIRVFLSNQMKERIYQKLLINAVVNPLTALFGVRNGELPNDPIRLTLMRALYDETEAILTSDGMNFCEDNWQRLLDICRATADNESSMLRDVRFGRITEIDAINGSIARLALAQARPAPLNEALTTLIKSLHILKH